MLLFKCTFLVLCFEYFVGGEISDNVKQDHCAGKRTCHQCIQTKDCAWCMQLDISDAQRCFQSASNSSCQRNFIWNPQATKDVVDNRKLTVAGNKRAKNPLADDIVQISPQRVSLKLRINEVHNLLVRYSQAEDYPVDLYYLMDLSNSMEDDKEKLSALGDLLAETMRNITSKFRLGFGSFVDKKLGPFVSTIEKNLVSPCKGCAAPYGFKNAMSLSTDTQQFATEVKNANVSGNFDSPEGGLDAIMQAVTCRQIIGWRKQAHRLLVFSTDAGFHYAGDAKLGGVIVPNDGECHLNSEGEYTHSEIQDYPSIAQINHKVKENSINIIFAVTASHLSIYKKLSQHIEGSSTAALSNDSSNVVDLVKEEYNKIFSSIEMKDNAPSYIKISYYSKCLNGASEKPTAKCDELKVGDIVNFTAKIMVTSCPSDPAKWQQTIQIYPVGINEGLTIDLEMLCSCPCENPDSIGYVSNSSSCNNHGNQICGICECDDLYYGNNCECSAIDYNSKEAKELACRADNVTTIDCNGRGYCRCGVCECQTRANREEIVSGRFCECDNFSCDRRDQQLCSGPDHGVCECGSCVCTPEWTGPSCDCRAFNDTCISPQSGEICSGNGKCECGVCKCKITKEGRYSGDFCENCPICSSRCQELRDCVQCQVYKTGPFKNDLDCAANCTTFLIKSVEKVKIDEEKDEHICVLYDEDDCKFTFKYSENEETIKVFANLKLECPPKVFILGIGLAILGTIVFVGLATLLLWKLLTTVHDRREFAKFEKERMNAQWNTGGNPIFMPATTTFQNPTYITKS